MVAPITLPMAPSTIAARLAAGDLKDATPLEINTLLNVLNDIRGYGAKVDGVRNFDGAITAGTPNFTSAIAVFAANDVGKLIIVQGAGASGAYLATIILAFVSSTAVTLAINAGTTVSGKKYIYGTDDTAAIKDAIASVTNSKFENTGIVTQPPGIACVMGSINIPKGVSYIGSGSRTSSIEWMTSSLTNFDEGVVQSIDPVISGTPLIMFSVKIKGLSISANGLAPNPFATRGWQENCISEDMVVGGGADFLFRTLTISETTHLATFKDFHVLADPFSSSIATLDGMDIKDTRSCNFRNFTIAQGPNKVAQANVALKIDGNSILNTFDITHVEDFDIGVEDAGQSNVFINQSGTCKAPDQTGVTHFKNINASPKFAIIGIRTIQGYTNHIDDGINIITAGANETTAFYLADGSGPNMTFFSKRGVLELFNGLKVTDTKLEVKDTQLHLQGPTGQGFFQSAIQGSIALSSTKHLVIDFSTTSAIGFGFKVEVVSVGAQRYWTENSFSGSVDAAGAVSTAKAGTQAGSSTSELDLTGLPIADGTPAAGIIRIPLINNDATFAQNINIKVTSSALLVTLPVLTLV